MYNVPHVYICTFLAGHSRSSSVADYPLQSSWEHVMQSRRGQSTFPGSVAEQRTDGGGGEGGGQTGYRMRQRYGQMGEVNGGHVTPGGTDVDRYQAPNGSQHSQRFTPTRSHTPSPGSPPSSPLTSIPRKKHSNCKPINVAVYSAPLSPHSEEKNPQSKRSSPPAMNVQPFSLQTHTRKTSLQQQSHQHAGDHTPSGPRLPPSGSGCDQSATPSVKVPTYQLATPPPRKPQPQLSTDILPQQPLFRTGSTSLTSSKPEPPSHSSSRRSSASGYWTQAPNTVAMATHQYSSSSISNPQSVSMTLRHSTNQPHPPAFGKQLSTRSLQGYPSSRPPTCEDRDNPLMSSSSSPALPTHTQHPQHGHTHHTPANFSHYHSPHSSQHHQAQVSISSYQSASNGLVPSTSVPLHLPPRGSQGASDVEAQPTPESMLQRQPVTVGQSVSSSQCETGGATPGTGMSLSSSVSHSYSNLQQSHRTTSQSSLTASQSGSKSRKTSDNRVPQIQVDPIPSTTLVTSSTRTKPTAAINEGGSSSSSPLHRKRMGHCRHLSLGNNIPRQRPTHSRNRSLGSVNFNHILPPSTISSRQESLGNLSLLSRASSKSGSRISLTSGFLSEAQVPQTPDPENGYDFVQHFNLFSQYTSNMALEYYTACRESSTHQPTMPPVWCMDVWNRIIAVGCGNGQIEVGMVFFVS